jgi:hypothetical protein
MLTNRMSIFENKFPFILMLIIAKPIFDLTWKWHLFYVGSFYVNINRIIAFLVPILLIYIVLIRSALHNKKVEITSSIPVFCILFFSFLPLIHSFNFSTINETLRIFTIFTVFVFAKNLIGNEYIFHKYLKWITIISLLPTFVGYLQYFEVVPYVFYSDFGYEYIEFPRISGGYDHHTVYLGYILICLPSVIYLYANKRISFVYLLTWMALTLPMVALSISRISIVIILLQIIGYCFFWKRKMVKWVLLIGLPIIIVTYWTDIYYVFSAGRGIEFFTSFNHRIYFWEAYLESFMRKDFLIKLVGTGDPYLPALGFPWPHSDFLKFLYVFGILGLISIILLAIDLFSRMFRKLVIEHRGRIKHIYSSKYFLGITIVFTWLFFSVTTTPLNSTPFGWNFALILSYIYSEGVKQRYVREVC